MAKSKVDERYVAWAFHIGQSAGDVAAGKATLALGQAREIVAAGVVPDEFLVGAPRVIDRDQLVADLALIDSKVRMVDEKGIDKLVRAWEYGARSEYELRIAQLARVTVGRHPGPEDVERMGVLVDELDRLTIRAHNIRAMHGDEGIVTHEAYDHLVEALNIISRNYDNLVSDIETAEDA